MQWIEMDENLPLAAEDQVDEQEIQFSVERIKLAMQSLPDGYRSVLSLYLLEGYDQEEIAAILHVAPSTVRTQYIRGKEKLLQLLKTKDHE